ncbi:MAG: glycosyltransferase family 4 protein [Fusobacteriaceae bacterium]|nr:glycosyltransferase family 4 protein [Fusobacteriaceae bacterium]
MDKKILYISASDPEYHNGGAIGTKKITKTLKDLKKNNGYQVYMVLSSERYKKNTENILNFQRKKWKAIICRILGLGDQLELYIEETLKIIKKKNIEAVIIQSSRLGNFTKKIKIKFPNINIIQNFDNFEYKFAELFTKDMNKVIQIIEKKNVKKSEKNSIDFSDMMLFLTNEDKENVYNFYNIKNKKSSVVPLTYECILDIKSLNIKKSNQIIFTGSLDMFSNINAAYFLIKNFDKIKERINVDTLIIAGRNPRKDLLEVNKERVKIIANPTKEEMEELLISSKLYLSPVFEGSGMKTKFLEAIAYGLPIVASEHTMIGYDTFDSSSLDFINIFRDFDSEDFLEKVIETYKKYENFKIEKFYEIRNFFLEEFSEGKVIEKIKKLIMEL